jgi:membrane protease YdiL (CAAX protease family)
MATTDETAAGLTGRIRAYPITAFFLIAVGLSFALLFPAVFIPQQSTLSQIVMFYVSRLGVYSPVLAGMIVSYISLDRTGQAPFLKRLPVLLIVWAIALVIQALDLNRMSGGNVGLPLLVLVSAPVALLPAFVISSATAGTRGVQEMLSTLVRPRGLLVYYLIALLAFPVIHYVGIVITNAMAGGDWLPDVSRSGGLGTTLPIAFLAVLFYSGGINEESGWRGFAQKRLQVKHSPLVVNLALWAFLVIWHIPNDIVQYADGGYWLVRFGLYPFITIIFGWIFNRTRGCILVPALFHASMNSMNLLGDVLPMTTAGNIVLIGVAILVVLLDRMWRKLPEGHAAVHQPSSI